MPALDVTQWPLRGAHSRSVLSVLPSEGGRAFECVMGVFCASVGCHTMAAALRAQLLIPLLLD